MKIGDIVRVKHTQRKAKLVDIFPAEYPRNTKVLVYEDGMHHYYAESQIESLHLPEELFEI